VPSAVQVQGRRLLPRSPAASKDHRWEATRVAVTDRNPCRAALEVRNAASTSRSTQITITLQVGTGAHADLDGFTGTVDPESVVTVIARAPAGARCPRGVRTYSFATPTSF
jgi:hypothetical protein